MATIAAIIAFTQEHAIVLLWLNLNALFFAGMLLRGNRRAEAQRLKAFREFEAEVTRAEEELRRRPRYAA